MKADVEPLDAFGASGWVDQGHSIEHSVVRLTTDWDPGPPEGAPCRGSEGSAPLG